MFRSSQLVRWLSRLVWVAARKTLSSAPSCSPPLPCRNVWVPSLPTKSGNFTSSPPPFLTSPPPADSLQPSKALGLAVYSLLQGGNLRGRKRAKGLDRLCRVRRGRGWGRDHHLRECRPRWLVRSLVKIHISTPLLPPQSPLLPASQLPSTTTLYPQVYIPPLPLFRPFLYLFLQAIQPGHQRVQV